MMHYNFNFLLLTTYRELDWQIQTRLSSQQAQNTAFLSSSHFSLVLVIEMEDFKVMYC